MLRPKVLRKYCESLNVESSLTNAEAAMRHSKGGRLETGAHSYRSVSRFFGKLMQRRGEVCYISVMAQVNACEVKW